MPKKLHIRSFHWHKFSSSSSNSSFENDNNCINKNTKKQQKIAEKMIKHGHGYDVLSDMIAPSYQERTIPYIISLNHDGFDAQKEHFEPPDNNDKRVGHKRNLGPHVNFTEDKMSEHGDNKNDYISEIEYCEIARDPCRNDEDDKRNENEGKSGSGINHRHSVHDAFNGIGGHGKHHGKHHHFGHHKMLDHWDKKDSHHSPKDHSATFKNHCPNDRNRVPDANDEKHGHGTHRRHTLHTLFSGLGGHGKHHGKHNNFGHHKLSAHEDKNDNHDSQVDHSPQEMDHSVTTATHDIHNQNDLPAEQNSTEVHHRYIINANHCKHLGRNHNFGHHKMFDHGDNKENQSQANKYGTCKEHSKDDLRKEHGVNKHDGLGGHRSYSFLNLFSGFRGLGGHDKHHGKHHHFGHHEMHDDRNNNHLSEVDIWGTAKAEGETPHEKGAKCKHGEHRRHSIHDIFSGLGRHGGHDKHHGKHHTLAYHKKFDHGEKVDNFRSQVHVSHEEVYGCVTTLCHHIHQDHSLPANQNNKYNIVAEYCRDQGKHHNFGHHRLCPQDDHHHGYHKLSPQDSPHQGHNSQLGKPSNISHLNTDDNVTKTSQ